MTHGKRLAALEAKRSSGWEKVHRIIFHGNEEGAEERALDAYGRDRIGPNDLLIKLRLVSPESEDGIVGGKMIHRPVGNREL